MAGFEITLRRGRRAVVGGAGEGRTHNMFLSAHMGKTMYGFI